MGDSIDYSWKTTDPRMSVNKRARIVILRPSSAGHGIQDAGTGHVDTKDGWYVHTSFEEHSSVHEGDKWPEGWFWTWAPT
jgi:hypothetical protein